MLWLNCSVLRLRSTNDKGNTNGKEHENYKRDKSKLFKCDMLNLDFIEIFQILSENWVLPHFDILTYQLSHASNPTKVPKNV